MMPRSQHGVIDSCDWTAASLIEDQPRADFCLSWPGRTSAAAVSPCGCLCACLVLGVTLVAATGRPSYRQVQDGLQTDSRKLSGGDLQVNAQIASTRRRSSSWMQERGQVSLLIELDTMMGTSSGTYPAGRSSVCGRSLPAVRGVDARTRSAAGRGDRDAIR